MNNYVAVEKRKMKPWKKVFITILIIFLVLAVTLGITGGVLWGMITNTDNKSKITKSSSMDILEPMLQSFVFGKEQQITDEEINGAINYVMNLAKDNEHSTDLESENNDVKITGANIYLHSTDSEIYLLVNLGEREFVVKATIDISLDSSEKKIKMVLNNCYVGTLPIAPSFLLSYLQSKEAFYSISDKIAINENTIFIPSEYDFDIFGYDLPMEITKLYTKEKYADIQTTSALENLKGMLGKYILSLLS